MQLGATLIIDCRSLQHNLQRLRKLAPSSKLIVIVKANAYGHGLLGVARALPDADAFGVARIEEALLLREGGITQPILLLGGFFSVDDLFILEAKQIQTIVHNVEQLEALEITKLRKPIIVWMKIDTGMNRLGVRQEQAEIFYQRLIQCDSVKKPINIISHFACANELACEATEQQLKIFNSFCKSKPGLRSIAASSGILFWPQSHFEWARPGIILYGISPLKRKPWGRDFGFKPVMSLVSSLITIRQYRAGEPVGYGGTWTSNHDTLLGVIAIGYGDGYPSVAPSGTPALINGREVTTVGRVTMDMICVDLGLQSQDKAGDTVILWGNGLPVERIAQITNISSYELITRLTSRVIMRYIN